MAEKTEYAVLQFVEQKSYCHMVHDSISGNTIMEYAKEHIMVNKEQAFKVVYSLALQLELYYKCEEQEAYGYVNPYAVIVNEEGEVRLLDIWSEENKEQIIKMKKKKVRHLFIRPEFVLSQKRRREDDLYGYGKTVLFLMENCCEMNTLTYREKGILKKIYNKCQSGQRAEIMLWKELQMLLHKTKKNNKIVGLNRMGILLTVASFLIGIIIGKHFFSEEEIKIVEKVVEAPVQTEEISLLELHVSWLELLQKGFLNENEKKQLEVILEKVMNKTDESQNGWIYQKCIAESYEKLERYDAAIVKYEEVISKVDEANELKALYLKLLELYELIDLPEKVEEKYIEALELFPELREDETFVREIAKE